MAAAVVGFVTFPFEFQFQFQLQNTWQNSFQMTCRSSSSTASFIASCWLVHLWQSSRPCIYMFVCIFYILYLLMCSSVSLSALAAAFNRIYACVHSCSYKARNMYVVTIVAAKMRTNRLPTQCWNYWLFHVRKYSWFVFAIIVVIFQIQNSTCVLLYQLKSVHF